MTPVTLESKHRLIRQPSHNPAPPWREGPRRRGSVVQGGGAPSRRGSDRIAGGSVVRRRRLRPNLSAATDRCRRHAGHLLGIGQDQAQLGCADRRRLASAQHRVSGVAERRHG